jgi:hypothetical protein
VSGFSRTEDAMKTPAVGASLLLAGAIAFAQTPIDRDLLAKIRAEGTERSQVAPVFQMLTIDIGPRLTASPAHKRAAEWARDRLASYGLQNAHLEPWSFGRGWTLDRLTVEMIEPRYLPLLGYADAWSPATSGELIATPVFIGGKSPEAVEAMRHDLKGAMVMTQPLMTGAQRAHSDGISRGIRGSLAPESCLVELDFPPTSSQDDDYVDGQHLRRQGQALRVPRGCLARRARADLQAQSAGCRAACGRAEADRTQADWW